MTPIVLIFIYHYLLFIFFIYIYDWIITKLALIVYMRKSPMNRIIVMSVSTAKILSVIFTFLISNSFKSIYRSFHIFNCRQLIRTSDPLSYSIKTNLQRVASWVSVASLTSERFRWTYPFWWANVIFHETRLKTHSFMN